MTAADGVRIAPGREISRRLLLRRHSEGQPLENKKSRSAAKERADGAATNGHVVDQGRIERAVREILLAVGEDPQREGLRDTPARVARMYAEMFAGLRADPREPLQRTFNQKYEEMVLVKDIDFQSMCEHHLLPFRGKAH